MAEVGKEFSKGATIAMGLLEGANLFIEVVSNLVGNTFQSLDQPESQLDWRDLDLALHEMYLFGELALPNQSIHAKNQPSSVASERLAIMMRKMVESGMCERPVVQRSYADLP